MLATYTARCITLTKSNPSYRENKRNIIKCQIKAIMLKY